MMAAHAVMAAEGRWVTNEKRLISDAGLGSLDDLLTDLGKDPEDLASLIDAIRNLCSSRLAVTR
jgi:hypothetical protein